MKSMSQVLLSRETGQTMVVVKKTSVRDIYVLLQHGAVIHFPVGHPE